MDPVDLDATVEWHAGYKGHETPRTVTIAGVRIEVLSVLFRHRVLDQAGGSRRDIWRCRLDDGRVVTIELPEEGAVRVSAGA